MKKYLMIFASLMMSVSLFAQIYPEVSIRDIQFVGDKIADNPGDYVSPYEGDTVITTGIVMNEAFIGGDPSNDYLFHASGPTVLLEIKMKQNGVGF